jgi:3-oxoacyl-[acyl-carrier protein] reductase
MIVAVAGRSQALYSKHLHQRDPSMNKVAVVTGASMGIGLAIARRFSADGFRVAMVARNTERLAAAALALGENAMALSADVAIRRDVEAIAKVIRAQFGHVDVLVNNAGLLETIPIGTPLDRAEEIFDRVVGASLKGAFLMSHTLIPIITSPGGSIVNVGSIVAHSGGLATGYSAYTPAKSGQHGLTMALARDLGSRGITVNTVAPGFIEATGQSSKIPAERIPKIVAQIPLNRSGTGDDIANAVAWLASPQASYLTGMTLPVNGGWRFY